MDITFAPKGILQIDDAKIVHRNFEGRGSQYNREGDRNFSVVIPTREMADELIEHGWNVKIKTYDDDVFMFLPVKIKYNGRGPNVYLVSGNRTNMIEESEVGCLDKIDIESVDLDIRPYDWDINGKQGRTAYLQAIRVVHNVDRFDRRYAEEEYPCE